MLSCSLWLSYYTEGLWGTAGSLYQVALTGAMATVSFKTWTLCVCLFCFCSSSGDESQDLGDESQDLLQARQMLDRRCWAAELRSPPENHASHFCTCG